MSKRYDKAHNVKSKGYDTTDNSLSSERHSSYSKKKKGGNKVHPMAQNNSVLENTYDAANKSFGQRSTLESSLKRD